MKKYTVYNSTTQEVIATGRPWPTADGVSQPPGLEPDVHILEEIKVANPPYDSATQKLGSYGEPVIDLNAKTATRTREVIALTQEEIDRRAEQAADADDREAIKAFALDIKNGEGTSAQRLARVERAVFRLLKDNYGG